MPPIPPPLSSTEEAILSARVRSVVQGFNRRRGWVAAFCVGVGILLVVHGLMKSYYAMALDILVALTLVSLWRSVRHFRTAARTGDVKDLHAGMVDLINYVRMSVILGVLSFVPVVLLLGWLGYALLTGAPHSPMTPSLHWEMSR